MIVDFSFFFSPVWIPWDRCFRTSRHITSTHYSHNFSPPSTGSDGFLWTTTSSRCCNVRRSSSCSTSTCCCNTRCGCITRCCDSLYRETITPVHAVILWRGLPTLHSSNSHPRVDIDIHEGVRRCNVRSQDVLCLGLFHEVTPAFPSAGRTRA